MISKIAITGLPKSQNTLMAAALSVLTDIPLIQNKTMYEWYRIFGFSETKKLVWKDMFLIASSSFDERTKKETYFERFISDGSSFCELMWLKSSCKLKSNQNEKVENFEFICASYAAKQYDFVIHADASENNDEYVQLFLKYQIQHKLYCSQDKIVELPLTVFNGYGPFTVGFGGVSFSIR